MITMLGVLRHSSDGAKVTFDQAFRAPAAELWDAVTNPDRLERWFARVDGDLVERAATILTSMGCRVVGPAEVREKLRLTARQG